MNQFENMEEYLGNFAQKYKDENEPNYDDFMDGGDDEEDSGSDEVVFDVIEKEQKELERAYEEGEISEEEYEEKRDKSVSTQAYKPVRARKVISEKEREELRKIYEEVVVHDFGDEYHMSEEERKEMSVMYDAFANIMRRKRKYRKLDEFIEVTRMCLDALIVVAENTGVVDKEEFIQKVLRGKISVYGLYFPKYIGKDKKRINWDFVSEYIANRELDPKSLVEDEDRDDAVEIDEEELFTDEELTKIMEIPEEEVLYTQKTNFMGPNEIEISTEKESKRFFKSAPEMMLSIKDLVKMNRKKKSMQDRLNMHIFDMTEDDFEMIRDMDSKRGLVRYSEMPIFSGDINNREDYKKYMLALEEYERNCIRDNYRGKMRTISEIEEIKLKEELEQEGFNIRKFYKEKEKEKKLKKAYEKDKKREDELKKRLLQIQKRQNKRTGDDVEFDAKEKKKKGKKKKKKNKEDD